MATVGPFQENSYLLRPSAESPSAVFVDPGDEAQHLLAMLGETGSSLEAILVTHGHIDHIGAVAELARATGAPVYAPRDEAELLRDPNAYVRFEGIPPIEGWDPEHLLSGGEQLELAGFDIEVLSTPGHSPGHLTYAIDAAESSDGTVLASGDVLFQGSVGRTDLPGSDHQQLMDSLAHLLSRFGDETPVLPGHMGVTTIGQEKATNPFLAGLPAS